MSVYSEEIKVLKECTNRKSREDKLKREVKKVIKEILKKNEKEIKNQILES